MTTDTSCEARIDGHLAGRLESFGRILAELEYDETSEAADEERYSYPLDVSARRVVVVLMSTGGPHDAFHVTVDDDGTPLEIEYRFEDWFDGATRRLGGDDFDRAAAFLEPFYSDD